VVNIYTSCKNGDWGTVHEIVLPTFFFLLGKMYGVYPRIPGASEPRLSVAPGRKEMKGRNEALPRDSRFFSGFPISPKDPKRMKNLEV